MNTGQKLVELSGLPSGSALAHLLAITQGTGTGRTVFAAQMTVCIESPQDVVVRRVVKTSVSADDGGVYGLIDAPKKRADVTTRPNRMDVQTGSDAMFVTKESVRQMFVRKAPIDAVVVRPKRI